MRSTKRLLMSVLLTGGLISSTAVTASSRPAHADSVNLTFLTWYAPPQSTELSAAIKVFESTHSGITITQTTVSGTGAATFPNALRIDIAGGRAPDLFTMWEGTQAAPFIDEHAAVDLTPYYKQYNWNNLFLPAAVNLIKRNGIAWGVPIDMRQMTFYYRKDVFSKYGLHVPTTYTQLEAVCTTLKSHQIPCMSSGGVYGWYTMRMFDYFLEHTAGPALHDKLLQSKASWNNPAVVAAFALLKKWTDNGWFPSGYMGITPTQGEQMFEQGKTAMMLEGDWMIASVASAGMKPDQYGFFVAPSDQKPVRLDGFAEQFMMSSQSKHPKEAAEFLNWWSQKDTQAKFYEVTGSSATKGWAPNRTTDPLGVLYQNLVAKNPTYQVMDQSFPPEFMSTTYFQLQSEVAAGSVTPASAAQQMQKGVSAFGL